MFITHLPEILRAGDPSGLADLIRIDTTNPPGAETAAARALARKLEADGISADVIKRGARPLDRGLVLLATADEEMGGRGEDDPR